MKKNILFIFTLFISITAFSVEPSRYPIIPKPAKIVPVPGHFKITKQTKLLINNNTSESRLLARHMINFFAGALGVVIESAPLGGSLRSGMIIVNTEDQSVLEPEGYRLLITKDVIDIKARTHTGAFWAFQTLKQMMHPNVEKQSLLNSGYIEVPCVGIKDAPRFAYRGLHLDVSRHMFDVAFIKKFIDAMAAYKLNKLHWHLTDDQGWRIEIKEYPRLQEIAAHRAQTLIGHGAKPPFSYDGKPYGGYYTQEQIKDIIEYAYERHITIIPEIELPGHCVAALAAYPELGCTNGPYKTATHWGVHDDVYCAGNEKVFEFLENVLAEVIDLFPSEYIHIGGDEVPKKRWKECAKCQERIKMLGLKNEDELQSYFIKRIATFVRSEGRRIVGWDEILEGGLASDATVMSWRGETGGILAASAGHDVIMTPHKFVYFDFYQSLSPYELLAIGGFSTVKTVYGYDPVPSTLNEDAAKHILGAQANIWTEYIKTAQHVEYMAFPRALALAEIVWTQKENKNYGDFLQRLTYNFAHLTALGIQGAQISG